MQGSFANKDFLNVREICDEVLYRINLARHSRNLPKFVYSKSLSACARLRGEQTVEQKEKLQRRIVRKPLDMLLETTGYAGSSASTIRVRGPDTIDSLIAYISEPSKHWSIFNPAHLDFGLYVSKSPDGTLEWTVITGNRNESTAASDAAGKSDNGRRDSKKFNISRHKRDTKRTIGDLRVIRKEVLKLVNVERYNRGQSPLMLNDLLNHCALAHTKDQIAMNKMTHVGNDGGTPGRRVYKIGYTARRVGENVAVGFTTPADVVTAWMGSPSHKKNILNGKFTELGVHVEDNTKGRRFWTQVFAAPSSK